MRLLPAAFLFALISSCSGGGNHPDVSDIKVDVKMERFEQAFFALDSNQLETGLNQLNKKFPSFYPLFIHNILLLEGAHTMGASGVELNSEGEEIVRSFMRWYRPVNDSIQQKYRDTEWIREDLEEAFRYVKYYFPTYPVPGVVTFLGTFDAPGMVITPNYLGIGLQQFAGKQFSAYQANEIRAMYPEYISRRFDEEYITAACMKGVVEDIYRDSSQSTTLIEQMIEHGKQWWLLDKFLPNTPDSIKTGYTGQQTDWLNENEGNIWTAILKATPDLYTSDLERIQNYLGESPVTQEIHPAAPGNLGQWVGWKIVQSFEQKNPKLTVPQILATPAKKLFQEAKYKPK